ncbi:MAG: hypothetical protein QM726_07125 [Chitinophagaceae bacterium]
MHTTGSIQYLTQQQIDKKKWDNCLNRSANGLIYAYSFYLDAMAKHWDGLVLNDYEAVMPLTWNKKWGFSYLYQPFLCANGGVFGQNLNADLTKKFLQHIPHSFRYWDIKLNHNNFLHNSEYKMLERKNYILALNTSYENLYVQYSDNVKRNIKKATNAGCKLTQPDFTTVIEAASKQLNNIASIDKDDFSRFSRLCNALQQEGYAITYGVCTADDQLVSSCIFLIWKNRAYYILPTNHPDSKSIGTSHMLIDAFIKDHANSNIIFDFEGSDIKGIEQLYRSFGGVEENYPSLVYNRLPVFIRWLKKS